jgi:hypothetical protein
MQDTEMLTQRLIEATSLPTVLDASWDIFDFIQQIASVFSDPENGRTFVLAEAAAWRGRNVLSAARSLRDEGHGGELPVCALGGGEQAAHVLATLAALVQHRLTEFCARAADHDDRRACGTGAGAAAEAHALLLTAGGGG